MKLFVTDFDGTLSKNHITISKQNKKMIKEWKSEGNHFAVATGRAVHLMKPILDSHGIDYDYLICCNGATIHKNNEILNESILPITLDDIEDIINLKEVESVIAIDQKGIHYQTNKHNVSSFKYRLRMRFYSLRRPFLKRHELNNLIQVTLRTHTNEGAVYATELLNKKGLDINPTPNKTYVDIVAGENTKASAIAYVAENESYEEIYTVGDEANDYDMIKTYKGYMMTDGNDCLKDVSVGIYDEVHHVIEGLLKGE